ncbi:hypothetical protein HSX11_25380 [Oxalobacteraceae bacterium]|nr:hypothetical protein [Oxalobacteraceae bacterium]
MTAMTTTTLRPLGAMETRMALMHRELHGTNQGCQICRLDGAVPSHAIWAAAAELFHSYQALRCAIVEQDGVLHFAEHGKFARIQILERLLHADGDPDEQRQHAFEEELNHPLEEISSLWRLMIVRGPAPADVSLVLTSHHAIVDGLAGFNLIDDLLKKIDRQLGAPRGEPAGDAALDPAIDQFLLPAREQAGVAPPAAAAGAAFRQLAPVWARRTRNEYVVLSGEEYAQLQSQASATRQTVNSLLGAALASAAVEVGMATTPVPLKSAVSLRHVAPATARLGCYIGVADAGLALEQPLDVVAKDYETQLFVRIGRQCMRRSTVRPEALLATIAQGLESTSFSAGIGLTFPGTIALSGRFEHFAVRSYDAAANRVGGNLAVVATVIGFHDQLTLGLAFVEPLIERATVAALGSAVRAILLDYAVMAEA